MVVPRMAPPRAKDAFEVRTPVRRAEQPAAPKRYRIRGRRATDLEWRAWQTLLRLGWREADLEFQVDELGGRRVAGGIVLDIVVWAPAMPIIVEPAGEYWHAASLQLIERDRERTARIEEAWARPFKYVSLPQSDFLTDEHLYNKLLRQVGKG